MLPDGEYEIDLSVLGSDQSASATPMALRYGFVPDSMSQSAPLKLYRDETTCVLEAQSTSRKAASSVIFEGVQQRQRPGNASNGDSFYLSIREGSSGVKVSLQQLSNTIRMSKSRNAEKWRGEIAQWERVSKEVVEVPNVSSLQQPAGVRQSKNETKDLKKKESDLKKSDGVNKKVESGKKVESVSRPKKAAKRPPTITPEKEIINMSDFEDIESDTDKPDLMAEDVLVPRKSKTESASKPKKRQKPTKATKKSSEDIDDDDFKDLEDQLQEVLESTASEESPNTFGNSFSESDEDEDDEGQRGQQQHGIVIDMADEDSAPKQKAFGTTAPKGKPMSLRELYGGSKAEDFSSSEEE
ncbi:hypothetical protein ACI3LY_004882 [Candidozyma auris]|nr:hypothetical_protein [[Candida] auris]KND97754.2 hypothetical protein QG37_06164 [[Candida] auris]QEO24145.1 hypothetical_protein [[Candida] auris]GBL52612.1 hypothetical protein CAJCM15448_48860 [[Candida] auris]